MANQHSTPPGQTRKERVQDSRTQKSKRERRGCHTEERAAHAGIGIACVRVPEVGNGVPFLFPLSASAFHFPLSTFHSNKGSRRQVCRTEKRSKREGALRSGAPTQSDKQRKAAMAAPFVSSPTERGRECSRRASSQRQLLLPSPFALPQRTVETDQQTTVEAWPRRATTDYLVGLQAAKCSSTKE